VQDSELNASQPSWFRTTHWSLVLTASNESDEARPALESLCRSYWYPLYAHVRRRGYDADEAQDLTQAFFARLLEKNFLRAADRNKGRLRTFLLTALDHFLAKEWRRGNARKRGGGLTIVSLDDDPVEERYQNEPAHDENPAKLFERRWALALLDLAMERLGTEAGNSGKTEFFESAKPLIAGDRSDVPQSVLAARLGITENAFNLALLRLRRRYGELIRDEIAQTVASPGEVDAELRYLMNAIRN
jgi:RNA polymerase sigma-70 factor (ECF subfamily)